MPHNLLARAIKGAIVAVHRDAQLFGWHVGQRGNVIGYFALAEQWLSQHMSWLSFLKPQAMGIIVLHLAAELGAALGAAGSVLQTGGLSPRDVVLALMVGNILSTPMRGIRHQLPSYSGFFRPALALRLILANQGLRAVSMTIVTIIYYYASA